MKVKNLPGIVKVRKSSFYTMVHSHPIQNDLEDLRAIGILAYTQSMDESFVLYKSYLYEKFSRRNVEAGIKELTEKNYWFSVKLHYNGQLVWAHYVSDVIFSEEQIIEEIANLEGAKFLAINTGYPELENQLHELYNSQKRCQNSAEPTVQNVQNDLYSTESTSNYNQSNQNQFNNNQDIKDVNSVVPIPVSKDQQRIESLKANWCPRGISPDWIEDIYQKSVERGIANKVAYVNKAATTYYDNIQKKNVPVSRTGKTEAVPYWFDKRNEQPEATEVVDFEEERQKLIKRLEELQN